MHLARFLAPAMNARGFEMTQLQRNAPQAKIPGRRLPVGRAFAANSGTMPIRIRAKRAARARKSSGLLAERHSRALRISCLATAVSCSPPGDEKPSARLY